MKNPEYISIGFFGLAWQKRILLYPGKEGTKKPAMKDIIKIRFSRKHDRWHKYEICGIVSQCNKKDWRILKINLEKI